MGTFLQRSSGKTAPVRRFSRFDHGHHDPREGQGEHVGEESKPTTKANRRAASGVERRQAYAEARAPPDIMTCARWLYDRPRLPHRWCSASRRRATRPGSGIVRGHDAARRRGGLARVDEHARFGGVVPEVASRAHLEAMLPTIERACATAGVALGDVDAVAVTSAARPGRCAAGRRGGRQGAGPRARQAALRREPPRGARGGRPARARAAARAVPGAARVRRPLVAAAGRGRDRRTSAARRDASTTRRGRPSTRWPGCSACRSRAVRTSTAPARDGDRVAIDFPRGLTSRRDLERHRFDFSFSGLKTAVARWVEARKLPVSRSRSPTSPPRSRRRSATCWCARPSTPPRRGHRGPRCIGGGVAANSRLRALAAGAVRRRGIRVRVPRPGLCTDNGAMVAALGAEMVARGRPPSSLDLPADSMPVTQVVA